MLEDPRYPRIVDGPNAGDLVSYLKGSGSNPGALPM